MNRNSNRIIVKLYEYYKDVIFIIIAYYVLFNIIEMISFKIYFMCLLIAKFLRYGNIQNLFDMLFLK